MKACSNNDQNYMLRFWSLKIAFSCIFLELRLQVCLIMACCHIPCEYEVHFVIAIIFCTGEVKIENGVNCFNFCWMHYTYLKANYFLCVNFQQGVRTSSGAFKQQWVHFRRISCTTRRRKRKYCIQACFHYYCTSVPFHLLI